jgi:class 3 adenylate cyclase
VLQYNEDALVTGAEAARALRVSRQVVAMWKATGKLEPKGRDGRSPLYRLGDVLDADIAARNSGYSHRKRRQLAA